MKGRFIQIPENCLPGAGCGITPSAGWTFVALLKYGPWGKSKKHRRTNPSIATLARMAGQSRNTIVRNLKALEEVKLISTNHRKGWSTTYTFPHLLDLEPVSQTGSVPNETPVSQMGGGGAQRGTTPVSQTGTTAPILRTRTRSKNKIHEQEPRTIQGVPVLKLSEVKARARQRRQREIERLRQESSQGKVAQ